MSSGELTDDDRERIRNYLDKPAYARRPDDLRPDESDSDESGSDD
ncbi:MAG: hypothetical protein ABEJ78_02530 [Haloferacaceae archaeon]